MKENKAYCAGKIDPALLDGVLQIRTDYAQDRVRSALTEIIGFTGKESIEKAGIKIIDIDDERKKYFSR